MTPQQKASKLYTDVYTGWCYELSHEKNYLTAKDIALYVCNEVLDHSIEYYGHKFWSEVKLKYYGHRFWSEVKTILEKSNHNDLYKTYEQ